MFETVNENYSIAETWQFKFADRLKKEREKRDWSQAKLAEIIGNGTATIASWEQCRVCPPFEMMVKLCDIFNCDLDYLTGRIDKPTHEISIVHDITGLSVEAIRKLQKMNTIKGKPSIIADRLFNLYPGETLSKVIEHEKYKELLSYLQSLMDKFKAIEQYWYFIKDQSIGMGELFRFDTNLDSLFDMTQYKASSLFSEILTDLTCKHEMFTEEELFNLLDPVTDEEKEQIVLHFRKIGKLKQSKKKAVQKEQEAKE